MNQEDGWISGGLGYAEEATEDERARLLDYTKMENPKMGISHQTLVSNTGRAARFPQYLAATVANVGALISGTCLGWTSPVAPFVEKGGLGFPVSTDNFSWVGSVMPLGAIVAGPLVGWLVERVGRKNTQLILVLPAVVGWALMAWAESVSMLIIGRFISGISGGGFSVVVPLYTNEFAEVEIRGVIGCFFQLLLNVGILFTYVVGYYATVFWLTVACMIIPLVYGALMLFMPESPIYYIKKGNVEQARQSLQWFRGREWDVEPELSIMQKNIEEMENEKVPFLQAFSTKAAKKGLIIGIGVMLFQQLSGINSVIFYTTTIFKSAGANIDPNIETIIVGVVNVVFTYISTLVIERMGRRPLLLLSDFFMAICSFVLGLYFYLQVETSFDTSVISWLPILSVCIFIVVFGLGYGPIPWMFVAEVNPRQIAGYAGSICSMMNWLGAFLVTKFFSDVVAAIQSYGAFWIFSAISAIGTVFVFFMVPETKGKTLEEVQLILSGRRR